METTANLGCLARSRRHWQKASALVDGEVAGESAVFEIRGEPALADVNAGNDGGGRGCMIRADRLHIYPG